MTKRAPQLGMKRQADLKSDIVDLEVHLYEARKLARLMYRIMIQFPTDMGEYDEQLDTERLPPWLTKEPETLRIGEHIHHMANPND